MDPCLVCDGINDVVGLSYWPAARRWKERTEISNTIRMDEVLRGFPEDKAGEDLFRRPKVELRGEESTEMSAHWKQELMKCTAS